MRVVPAVYQQQNITVRFFRNGVNLCEFLRFHMHACDEDSVTNREILHARTELGDRAGELLAEACPDASDSSECRSLPQIPFESTWMVNCPSPGRDISSSTVPLGRSSVVTAAFM